MISDFPFLDFFRQTSTAPTIRGAVKTIWKYPLSPIGASIEMPAGSQVLCIQMQNDVPYLWVLVDPGNHNVIRSFVVRGTGHQLPDDPGKYIGTFQMDLGRLVFHLFEIIG